MLTLAALFIATVSLPVQERVDISREAWPERAHVRGVVIDKRSGEPVAGTTIMLLQRSLTEVLKTDDRGYFVSAVEYSKRTISVYAWDNAAGRSRHSVPSTRLAFDPATTNSIIHECRLDVGRRIALDLTLPAGWSMDDLCAVAVRPGHAGSTRPDPLSIHEDDPPWVRYGSWSSTFQNAAQLRIATRDGLHAAVIDLDSAGASGLHSVHFRPCGILAVRAFGGKSGRPRSITLQLVRAGRGPGDDPETITMRAGLVAEARIQWIPPGEWTLSASSPYFRTSTKKVFVAPLGVTRTAIQLRGELQVGVLRIIVAEEVGDVLDWKRFNEAPRLNGTARSVDGRLQFRIVTTAMCGNGVDAWFKREHRGGRFVYEAAIEDVPAGDYVVSVQSDRLLDRHAAQIQPDETATFMYIHGTPEDAIGLRVTSASPSLNVSHYWLSPVHEDSEFPLSARPTGGGLHAIVLPGDTAYEWFVYSFGFQRAYGSRASFARAAPPERGLWADVVLKPGYGIRLRAQDPSGKPLPGVKIDFGGRPFRTDSAGLTYLSSSMAEPKLQLQIEGLTIVGGNVRRDGSFDGVSSWPSKLSEL
ncbi:MAG: hypothetical protein ACI8Y8_001458, partial [Planctomycetota bacterium]